MINLLEKFLKKKGIEKPEDLTQEEKKVFDEWQIILGKEELTLDDVKTFCQSQIDVIETHWKDLTIANEKKSELIPYHTTYKTLLMAIDSPKAMRSALETQLNQMLQQ